MINTGTTKQDLAALAGEDQVVTAELWEVGLDKACLAAAIRQQDKLGQAIVGDHQVVAGLTVALGAIGQEVDEIIVGAGKDHVISVIAGDDVTAAIIRTHGPDLDDIDG